MNGFVDAAGRALLQIDIQPSAATEILTTTAWTDTGFTGDLVLPQRLIDDLGLTDSGTVGATLADGSRTIMRTYECRIDGFGDWRALQVVANNGEYPLLGIGLLLDHELQVNYRTRQLTID